MLARAFGHTTTDVRRMTYRDIQAMVDVLEEEALERAKAEAKANARKGRR